MRDKPTYEALERRVRELEISNFELKRAVEPLRESEALFRNLFERHAAVQLFIDPHNGNMIDANGAAEEFYGWTREQLQQMRIQEINILPPEEVTLEMEKARTKQRIYFEFQHRLADGSIRDVEVFSSKIQVKGKDLLHSIIHDITARKQAERTLRESEQSFSQLFESAPVPMAYASDVDGYKKTTWNKAWYHTFGYAREQAEGKSGNDIGLWVNPSDRSRFIETANRQNYVTDFEAPLRRRDGAVRECSIFGRFIDKTGHRLLMAVYLDITNRRRVDREREKLQAQLSQAQKMESVGRLAGGVAHDFNNMLGAILGYTELGMLGVSPTDPTYGTLTDIQKAAQQSANLTRQLLAFARKQTVAPQLLDLNVTVEGMLKMLRRLIGEDIDLEWLPGKDLDPVRMDPSQIEQLLANLCVNARDAIHDTGKITVETGAATVDEKDCIAHVGMVPGEYVLLAVKDNGCGMDAETRTHLFEPFFTTKEVGKGTGLGLATVYGMVKQNNGFIEVHSEPGRGTTVDIYLPRNTAETGRATKTDAAQPTARGHETILLVEDEPMLLDITTKMLERQGYTVRDAATPGEAIRLAREHAGEIHLVMTDVVMPEMNGRDLAKNLLSLYPDLKRLFMSGYTADVIAHHGVLDEGVQFIQKPFSVQTLAVKVREVLDEPIGATRE
ncbi:PAS domain S-box protein [Desulfosarcina sp.]|uniref:hybrid sensor histidine kinase/response regulator n=1 Tax=Desulfosarcina sp. TaxID=2027861 RepID=UPI003564F599